MMRSYEGSASREAPTSGGYRVVGSAAGWRVEVNGCVTRPFTERETADRIARSLQRERDQMIHAATGDRAR